jgi:alginate O-acetyltransferase complex protein AlgI
MNFASYDFRKILFLCYLGSRLVIATTGVVRPASANAVSKLSLLATALILLGSESWLTLAAFLWVVLLGWVCILIQTAKWQASLKTTLFTLLLAAQLAPLFYFKYWNFVLNECLGLDVSIPFILIPMGLSFYTFQTIGFWVDHLRNPQPRPTFLDYLNFSSFFPQIVAGPIEKSESLLPQIEKVHFKIHLANLEAALRWIIVGLAYKLIVADNLGNLSDKFTIDPANAWQVWFECITFGIRIYFDFDFAGYSFIAVGLGLLFGVHLTLNFRWPYWSTDLREFWRNWHVTLGAWLRDYIYLPLGGRRVKWWAANTLIVFLVSGIWHGAGWGFLIWGLMHGLGVAFCGSGKS